MRVADRMSATLGSSSSAPALPMRDSPYAQSFASTKGSTKLTRTGSAVKKWKPPPGAFNNPDYPTFSMPGPARYKQQVDAIKPRITGVRFGSEDRFKYLGPQQPLERTSSGMAGMYNPQAASSPGPGYLPNYKSVLSASRESAFTVNKRDTSGIPPGSGAATAPGPGLYTPNANALSGHRNNTGGGAFLADDRHKYLGNVDADSGGLRQNISPGPLYNPSLAFAKHRAPTVAFGGRGPGTIKKVPTLKQEAPGPGAYTLGDSGVLSGKNRAPVANFGSTQRGDSAMVDSVKCFHGKVQVDMTNATNISASPGPAYNPSDTFVKTQPPKATIGTAKRSQTNLAIVH